MTAVEVLRTARDLIADPERWCQGVLAEDAECEPVSVADPAACRWCALGATYHASGVVGYSEAVRLLDLAADEQDPEQNPVDINDNDGHAAVLAMYDRAIELAEAGQ